MKQLFLIALLLCLPRLAFAQFGSSLAGAQGPRLGGPLSKVFGENKNFKSELTMIVEGAERTEMSGALSFSEGKTRFDMDMTSVKSRQLTPEAATQMKAMGMDKMVMITRPDSKTSFLIYPGLESFVEMTLKDENPTSSDSHSIKFEELSREKIDGMECIKNRVIISDSKGDKQEATVWNATGLKNFPVMIEHNEGGQKAIMKFQKVKLENQPADNFSPSSKFTRYDDFGAMIQGALMKRLTTPSSSKSK